MNVENELVVVALGGGRVKREWHAPECCPGDSGGKYRGTCDFIAMVADANDLVKRALAALHSAQVS